MRYKKTYGIHGLLEWHGDIVSNGAKMRVSFTNGSTTAYGVAPATFTTGDPLTQHIIENSDQFKNGRIVVVRSAPIPGTENDGKAAGGPVHSTDTENRPEEGEGAEGDDTGGEGAGKVQVKVSSVEDAKDYLVEHFGIAGSKLRTRAACIAAGEENGIEFVWE